MQAKLVIVIILNVPKCSLLQKVEVNYLCSLQIAQQVNLPEYIVNVVEVDYTYSQLTFAIIRCVRLCYEDSNRCVIDIARKRRIIEIMPDYF